MRVARRDVLRQPLLEGFHRFDVLGAGKVVLARPARQLALDVLALAAIVAEADRAIVDVVQAREHIVHRVEYLAAIGRRDARHLHVGQDAPGQELHDVEGRADHGIVLAERVGLGHRHVGVVRQRLDHAVFAVDLVGRR
jgi:hypothetical protein